MDLESFGEMVRKVDPNLAQEEIDVAFKKFDSTQNGFITQK
jgi:Ca2+-binding EF-hand superfamily protein